MRKSIFVLVVALLCATMLTSCDLILNLFIQTGIVTGIVQDASGNVVAGVLVTADGTNESTTTDSSGSFTIELPEGSQTLHFTKTGYTFYDITILVTVDVTVELDEDVIGYTPLMSGEIRIVLSWGENPRDLDSHLLVPGVNEEIYYSYQDASDGSANLDWDDTTSYGPETITITDQNAGTYYYSVYHYAGDSNLGSSGAVVRVYDDSGLWRTYEVSNASGDDAARWWRVFSLNGSTITSLNAMSDTRW